MAWVVQGSYSAPEKKNELSAKIVMVSERDMAGVIKEFKDVFLKELPNTVPPQRAFKFENQNDPGEAPSSLPVARLSMKEHKEYEKRLEELLKRELIAFQIPNTVPLASPFGRKMASQEWSATTAD